MDRKKSTFFKNYGATLLLLLGLLAGGVLGALLGESARVLRPVGMLFLNLVFVLVVPLVFFSVARSLVVMHESGVIGKVLGTALGVFLFMSLVAGIFSFGLMSVWNPFSRMTVDAGSADLAGAEALNLGDAIVAALTVDDSHCCSPVSTCFRSSFSQRFSAWPSPCSVSVPPWSGSLSKKGNPSS